MDSSGKYLKKAGSDDDLAECEAACDAGKAGGGGRVPRLFQKCLIVFADYVQRGWTCLPVTCKFGIKMPRAQARARHNEKYQESSRGAVYLGPLSGYRADTVLLERVKQDTLDSSHVDKSDSVR